MKKNKKWIIIGVIAVVVIIGYRYYKAHPEKFGVATV
jgi:predicted negative regulator of RcsB-dependent stress response